MGSSPRTGTGGEATKGPEGLPLSVAAVICTRGTTATLADALHSVAADLREGDDLLVVVDGGPLAEAASSALPPNARLVVQPATGLGAARQRALDAVIADLVLFVDDDEIVHAGWRDALVAAFADERVAAVGGTIEARWPDGDPPRWLHDRLRAAFGERRAGPGCGYPPFGGNLAVRRDAARAVGGFSAELGHGPHRPGLHEDAELCRRLVAAGWAVAEAPGAVVEHLVRPDQVRLRWLLRRAWHEGRADAQLARMSDGGDGIRRTGKLLGLTVAAPLAALRPRLGAYVAARLLVNLGYLWARATRRLPHSGVNHFTTSREVGTPERWPASPD